MKVCYIGNYGNKMGGGQQSLLNIIDEVTKQGVEVHLASHKEWELTAIAREKGAKVFVLPMRQTQTMSKQRGLYEKIKRKVYLALAYIKNIKIAEKYLIDNEIDIVHLNGVEACQLFALAALRLKIPYVWHIREFLEDDYDQILATPSLTYKLLKKAASVIAVSKTIKRKWEDRIGRSCDLIYNGVSLEDNYDDCLLKFNNDEINCIIIGRIMESKGQVDAVRAMEELVKTGYDNYRLCIVGYRGITDYEIRLKKYVEEHKLDPYIVFEDFTYDLKEYRKKADIGLICSRAEAFGRVTIEYQLAGLLVIGAKAGGTEELISEGETGYLYHCGDYEELCNIIIECSCNRKKSKAIALQGQNNAIENYLIESTTNRIMELYTKITLN